jgi:hypothetical protein
MEWQDEETQHPWESGGDLPWTRDDEADGWTPADPEAWRGTEHLELPLWPEFNVGPEAWHPETDED